jgi:hypothetical protein
MLRKRTPAYIAFAYEYQAPHWSKQRVIFANEPSVTVGIETVLEKSFEVALVVIGNERF